MSNDEERAEREEVRVEEGLEHVTETEREDLIMDNDVLVDRLQEELEKHDLTQEQMEKLKELGEESDERFKKIKEEDQNRLPILDDLMDSALPMIRDR